ncbi:MAG: 1-acyl-sn-glycerol-3-phosphate acyltransferase [Bacteroidetes bacterium]|nr:1-acyl-sn-glycerol-3-phosphate acyltransferase [Bacteroidota bacterium]
MEKIFISIYNYFEKNRAVFFTIFISCFLLIGWFAAHVQFEEDISKVLPKDKKIEKLNQVFQNSRFADKLVVMISLADSNATPLPDSLADFAEHFVPALKQKLPGYISKIDDKVNDDIALDLYNSISDHLPIYLDEKDYRRIDSLIAPATVKTTLENDFRTLSSPAGIALKKMISDDPVGISFLGLKKMQQLQYDENFELFDNYVITKDHKQLLVFVTPAYPPNNTGKNAILLQGIDAITDSLANSFKNIDCSYFGATAVSTGNALQLRRDTLLTQGVTIVFLICFIGFYFRKKRAPFLILVPVLFGALFSLSAIYFIKSTISVIALGTGSVILGIAVNYSLHLFNHYRHTRNIKEVIRDLSMPLTVGSFTTIGGFLCLEFVQSEMLKDLGLFAAFSLIGASLCTLIFLPHLIASDKDQKETRVAKYSWIDKISSYRPEYNKILIIFIIILTIVFADTAKWVGFESDLARMNYMPEKLKQAEDKLKRINVFSLQSVYVVSEGKNLNEALEQNEKMLGEVDQLKQQGIVGKYSGVSSLIMSDSTQKIKIARWNNYWTPDKKQQLISTLKKEGALLKFKPMAFDRFEAMLNKNFQPSDSSSDAFLRKNFLDDYITEKPENATVVTLLKVTPENKKAVYNELDKNTGVTVLDKQYLTSRFVDIINSDFSSIAWMTSILVFIVLLLTYGRIELTLISFIPMFITFIWILGIMGILGIRFNIINIIISAFIFGLGDDYSLFIMDGLLQEYKTGKQNLSSYKSSIFLSAITTVAGLGVLIFAKHPALRSIAAISIIGIVCVVIMSQILIPFLFAFLIKNRIRKNKFPWTFMGLAKSIFSFTYFVVGSLLLTVIGFIFVKLNPFNKEKGKYIYHAILSKFCWSLMYIMGNVKKRIIRPPSETFSKPAFVICNHQSFLDILMTVLLHPKLILFTNHWVWNSPVFGAVVRMADFYPIMQGADGSHDLLTDRIKKGYSVVIFPEGTRSQDGTMKRFHKGAFFLAEKLQMDILPVIIHGSGYTMTKNDFLLKDGTITLKFLPRISPGDERFGDGYAERAKKIGRYFRNEFYNLKTSIEQTAYFKEQLIYNYIYKGPVLEWYLRIKLKLENNYQLFHELLPSDGKLLDLGCGYGFMCYMMHFTSPSREITGVDYDEEKIETANNCFGKDERIHFVHADAAEFNFEKYDGIVLSDVLHYLQPLQQKKLIEKCIDNLNPNGKIIIREGNRDLKERHQGTRLTEFFSTKFFGFNKTTSHGLSFISGNAIREIAAEKNMTCVEIDNTKYTSNMIFVVKHSE